MTNTMQIAAIQITTKPINLDKNQDDMYIVASYKKQRCNFATCRQRNREKTKNNLH